MISNTFAKVLIPRVVTTSWDDGDPQDLRIAELLRARGLTGTFYVPILHRGRPILGSNELRLLVTEGLEVGAHGLSHQVLVDCNADALTREVEVCKFKLEDVLGREVTMFAYPKGLYSAKVIRSVEKAGYTGSRTAQMLHTHLDFNPFEMPITLQVYPHTRSAYVRNAIKATNFKGLRTYVTRFSHLKSWVEIGKGLFDIVLKEGGVWHLFGHSWEIGRLELWRDLEEILDYVGRREQVIYACNGDVTRFCKSKTVPEGRPA